MISSLPDRVSPSLTGCHGLSGASRRTIRPSPGKALPASPCSLLGGGGLGSSAAAADARARASSRAAGRRVRDMGRASTGSLDLLDGEREGQLGRLVAELVGGLQLDGELAGPVEREEEADRH